MRILHNKAFIIALLSGTVVLLILIGLALRTTQRSMTTTPNNSQLPVPSSRPINSTTQSSLPPVKISFEQYDVTASLPTLPDSLTVYSLKTNYSKNEAAEVAARFGLTSVQDSSDQRYILFSNLTEPEKRGLLTFDSATGSFIFQSFGNHQPRTSLPQQSPLLTAQLFIREVGFDDTNIRCVDTYEKESAPGRVFVECHRTVDGATILGFPGVLNISENIPLTTIKLGKSTADALEDRDIIRTSNDTDGKIRSNDSNTITLEIARGSNRILSLISNLRTVYHKQSLARSDLLTPQEALQKFQNNAAEVSAALPAGTGNTDLAKMFSNGIISGTQARITDYIIVYPEKPAALAQNTLAPYYLVRGVGVTQSGLPTKFVQLLPATKNNISFTTPTTPEVAGVFATNLTPFSNQRGSQKQGGFDIPSEPTVTSPIIPTITPATTFPTPTTVPGNTPTDCTAPTGATVSPLTLQIPGVGQMEVLLTSAHMFFFKSANFPIGNMQQIRQRLYALVEDQYVINISHWLSEDPSFQGASIASVANASTIYQQINQHVNTLNNNPGRNPSPLRFYEAPLTNQSSERLQTTVANVTQKLIAAQQKNSVATIAQTPNIFPNSVLSAMYFVLTAVGGEENDGRWGTACYISGSTPSIFAYSKKSQTITLGLPFHTTYIYPEAENNAVSLSLTAEKPAFLYYEYNPATVTFTPLATGWIMQRKNVHTFIDNTLVPALGLNEQETKRFHQEINLAFMKSSFTDGQLFRVSVADETELNEQLPLTLSSPLQNVYRFHLLLQPVLKNQKLMPPTLAPVKRSEHFLIELGARVIE